MTGGGGDVSWSLDFGIPPTGGESNVPGWDEFDPLTEIGLGPDVVGQLGSPLALCFTQEECRQSPPRKCRLVSYNSFLSFTHLVSPNFTYLVFFIIQ